MNRYVRLAPYWFLNFTIGFGWFTLAPLVPALGARYNVGSSAILLLISLYGYTMVAFALLSGYLSARYSVRITLIVSGALSAAGLIARGFSSGYDFLFVAQTVAAIAYPLALGPVGAIAQSVDSRRSHTIVGISVGILFLGMSMGAFLTPYLYSALGQSITSTFLLDGLLALVALITLLTVVRDYPVEYAGRSLKGTFRPGMIKNWYVGLVISSLSVMFGGIAADDLISHGVKLTVALTSSGYLTGLAFLGSALGAIILPPLFERIGNMRFGMVFSSVLTLVSIIALTYYLGYTSDLPVLAISYFSFGFFGNAFWSMAMTSTTRYVEDPARSGFSTSMYSVATNLGVALIPVFYGPFFLGHSFLGVIITSLLVAVGFILSFTLVVGSPNSPGTGSPSS